jgi:hypothetical protein
VAPGRRNRERQTSRVFRGPAEILIALIELVDPACRVHQTLLSSEKRVQSAVIEHETTKNSSPSMVSFRSERIVDRAK